IIGLPSKKDSVCWIAVSAALLRITVFARGVEMIEVLGRLISNSPIKRDRLHVTRVENEIRFIPPWSSGMISVGSRVRVATSIGRRDVQRKISANPFLASRVRTFVRTNRAP
ncbi:MAG TPA: hypothetical protein VFQ43_07270, partial [Nitrososphaera sp.]|nr:hypothetical protein [Nitrososphaera sp.]